MRAGDVAEPEVEKMRLHQLGGISWVGFSECSYYAETECCRHVEHFVNTSESEKGRRSMGTFVCFMIFRHAEVPVCIFRSAYVHAQVLVYVL